MGLFVHILNWLVFACWAGRANRQEIKEFDRDDDDALRVETFSHTGRCHPCQALAKLLLASNPAAGWSAAKVGHQVAEPFPLLRCASQRHGCVPDGTRATVLGAVVEVGESEATRGMPLGLEEESAAFVPLETLKLLYCDGLSLGDIAEKCSIPEESVLHRLQESQIPEAESSSKKLSLFDEYADVLNPVVVRPYDPAVRVENDQLFWSVKNYILSRISGPSSLVVSLSGGVDSMVLSHCLLALASRHELQVSFVHVDYGMREISAREAAFLRAWASMNNATLKVRELHGLRALQSQSKKVFEAESRKARYDAYREAMEETGALAVCAGQHRDDMVENVLDHLVTGRSLFHVKLADSESITENLLVWRPLGAVGKKQIRQFAVRHCIPHLQDLDDPGDMRVLWRSHVKPAITRHFGEGWLQNAATNGRLLNEWKGLIDKFILAPFLADVAFFPRGAVVPFGNHTDSPEAFWKEVLIDLFRQLRSSMLSNGALDRLVKIILSRESQLLQLHQTYSIYVDSVGNRLIILDKGLLTGREDAVQSHRKMKLEDQQQISYKCGEWNVELTRDGHQSSVPTGLPALLSGNVECLLSHLRFGDEADDIPSELAQFLPFRSRLSNAVATGDDVWSVRAHIGMISERQ